MDLQFDEPEDGGVLYDARDMGDMAEDDEKEKTRMLRMTRQSVSRNGGALPIGDDADEHDLVADVDYDVNFLNIMETIGWAGIAVMVFCLFTTLVLMGRVSWLPRPDHMFGIYIGVFLGTFTVVTIVAGYCRVYWHVNISYTRKVTHFFSFFLPFGLSAILPFEKTATTYILTFCTAFVAFIPLMDGIRNIPCMWPLRLAYASFDRREDRPLTLLWAVTQALMVYAVMLPCIILLEKMGNASYILIPLVVTGFGDGLAEPVGKAFGRHKYRAAAMCTSKEYTRSIEGSLVIVATGVIVVSTMFAIDHMSLTQFLVAFFAVPIPMAIAEAKSPHSWDNPFLLLVGGTLAIGISALQYTSI